MKSGGHLKSEGQANSECEAKVQGHLRCDRLVKSSGEVQSYWHLKPECLAPDKGMYQVMFPEHADNAGLEHGRMPDS